VTSQENKLRNDAVKAVSEARKIIEQPSRVVESVQQLIDRKAQPIRAMRNGDLNGKAAALVTLAGFTGDAKLQENAEKVQKAAVSATQVYQAVQILAAGGLV
jgi:hypothetical protein